MANVGVLGDCFTTNGAEDNGDDAGAGRWAGRKEGPAAPKGVVTIAGATAAAVAIEFGCFEAYGEREHQIQVARITYRISIWCGR